MVWLIMYNIVQSVLTGKLPWQKNIMFIKKSNLLFISLKLCIAEKKFGFLFVPSIVIGFSKLISVYASIFQLKVISTFLSS